ncbi:M56 family metallopeptidase [Carboxylicivirga sp. M1479]|uniref:M56 family metallopeptidase n=1 Tax=Carboxylicivirga sp. M1479 TaxID=2594476 RepID=UPI0011782D89|nr:M56 family metallopeptidase [Carboxylicivirga sp. M1479]TRX66151.1 hypothetical protein FNN09_15240 [Carboxylicivirga sp. M1479]
MTKFLIYLFESGMCLSLFYLGYITFFRKETYFTFNRLYLIMSMVLALLLPLSSVQLSFESSTYVSGAFGKVNEFRNYYEELILLTEPDFVVSNESSALTGITKGHTSLPKKLVNSASSFNWSSILFYTYIGGLLFFIIRLLLLIYNLYAIIRRNKVIYHDEYKIVLINEEMPSFSFVNWIFVNKKALKHEEFEQVIAHEKVHVQQKHSVDLLLAQVLSIFQWFNPLTWRIQKSIKTCHEYIADRQVIGQGHELFDYQSLLLSQLISIRSVELVNNFNLLSIKKRIAMMNKIKSGRRAQLKALMVIPLLTLAFFFFADMTGKTLIAEKNREAMNIKAHPVLESSENSVVNKTDEVTDSQNEQLIEKNSANNANIPSEGNLELIKGNYQIDLLSKESSESSLLEDLPSIKLPTARAVKVYNEAYVLSKLLVDGDKCFVGGKKFDINSSNEVLQKLSHKASDSRKSIILEIDVETSMKEVDKIKHALRLNNLLKIGYAAEADKSSKVKSSSTAIVNLLPPNDAKMLSKEEAFFEGIKMFTISSSSNLKNVSKRLRDHIEDNKKYVILYEYNDYTSYDDYIQTIDMIYSTVWKLRQEYAFSNGVDYDNMTKEEEKKLRKKYPLTLTMRNIDSDN